MTIKELVESLNVGDHWPDEIEMFSKEKTEYNYSEKEIAQFLCDFWIAQYIEIRKRKENYTKTLEYLTESQGILMEMQMNCLKIRTLKTSNYNYEYSDFFTNKEKTKQDGFIYIAKQLNEENVYKIGITIDLKNRVSTLKTGNAFLEVISSLKTDKYKLIEKVLHSEFECFRIAGEWFEFPKGLIEEIIKAFGFNYHLEEQDEI